MLTNINGPCYIDLLKGGIESLEKHRTVLNDLNVFPVPDGDTGTNMVMTLRYGFEAIKEREGTLHEIAARFASSAVFGARGNSGVILSQFFKGLAESFAALDEANCLAFANALENGYRLAYAAVAKPVEGTILTVLRDAVSAVRIASPLASIEEAVSVYLAEARASLARTPQLLPVLKKAGVVDSGASGIVYFFEGVQKRLRGETIELAPETAVEQILDLSMVNKDTDFTYGYCTEGLIQLKICVEDFDAESFKAGLERLGTSIVVSLEQDKIKLHIHTKKPGKVMEHCQRIGEFLTIKIENMSLQHLQKAQNAPEVKRFLYAEEPTEAAFAVVAVATTPQMQQTFFEMGADVVILSDIAPSSQDFMDAFGYTKAKDILVFPNSSNSILTSMQAGGLYKSARVTVLNCRSAGECYASLSTMDFESTADAAVAAAKDTISSLYEFAVYHATKNATYGNQQIAKNEFFALSDKTILQIGTSLDEVTLSTARATLQKCDYSVLTVFFGKDIAEEYIDHLISKLGDLGFDIEIAAVSTEETVYSLSLMFE